MDCRVNFNQAGVCEHVREHRPTDFTGVASSPSAAVKNVDQLVEVVSGRSHHAAVTDEAAVTLKYRRGTVTARGVFLLAHVYPVSHIGPGQRGAVADVTHHLWVGAERGKRVQVVRVKVAYQQTFGSKDSFRHIREVTARAAALNSGVQPPIATIVRGRCVGVVIPDATLRCAATKNIS